MPLLRSVWVPLLTCAEIGLLGCAGVGRGASGRAPGRAGSGRGQGRFDFKPSFWGPSQLNLSPGPNFVSSVIFNGGPFYVANTGTSWTVTLRKTAKQIEVRSSITP